MQTNELIGLVVVGLVGCILVAGFIPVLNETVDPDTTFTNNGYYRMAELTGEDTATFVWDATDKLTLTINDVDYDMPSILTKKSYYFTLFGTDTTYFRMAVGGAGTNVIGQVQKSDGTTMAAWNSDVAGYDSVTIEVGGGDISVTRVNAGVPTTITTTYTDWAYAFNPNGNFMMKDADSTAYVLTSSPIYLMGVTAVNSTNVAVYGEGTIEGITLESIYPDDDTIYSNTVINSEAVASYIELNKLGNITFDMTRSDVTASATYSYYLVPYEVTAEKTAHADSSTASMIALLPLILIMGIVLMFVGAVLVKRYV